MNVEPSTVQNKRKSHPGVKARKRRAKYAALQFVTVSRSLGEPGEICTAPPPVAIVEAVPSVQPVRKALVARLLEADRELADQTKELALIRNRLHSAEAKLDSQNLLIRSLKKKLETYRRKVLELLALAPTSAPLIPPGSPISSPDPIQLSQQDAPQRNS